MPDLNTLMRTAIAEAEISLRAGNSGFGAVIARDGEILAQAHDTDKTSGDPTAHAEMAVIRSAAGRLGNDAHGCVLVTTHEPCPMCATALVWSGVGEIAYGYTIKEALLQGRKRIALSAQEVFARAGKEVLVHEGVLHEECAVLYNAAVRDALGMLRGADQARLEYLARELSRRRQRWFAENYQGLNPENGDPLAAAYQLFLHKLGITADDAPVVHRDVRQLVIRSTNFCPTLEACRILALDTRFVCRHLNEKPMTELLQQLHPRLRFARNYNRLRPEADFCEEMIILDGKMG